MRLNVLSTAWVCTLLSVSLALDTDFDTVQQEAYNDQSQTHRPWRLSHRHLQKQPDLRVIIMTMNRRESFQRLWNSLQHAVYNGDRIDVDVWVDRNSTDFVDSAFVQHIQSLTWPFGVKKVHVWKHNAGVQTQWIDTWFLSCGSVDRQKNERAIILEDDLTLSPYFYRWLKAAHHAYKDAPQVAAFTLTRASLCPANCPDLLGGPGGDDTATHFLSPLVGSWGLAPKASHWIAFREWYHAFVAYGHKPYVDGLVTTEWYKIFEQQGRQRSMWTVFHIKYVADALNPKPYTLYVKAPNATTLASNHKEKGLHYSETAATPDHPLLTVWDESMQHFPQLPMVMDWEGHFYNAV